MNRRHFLQVSFASSLAIPAFALEANNPYRKNIGIQLYTLRNELKKDLPATLYSVGKAGYQQVEPYGFPDDMALEMVKVAKDEGMAVNSSHFAWESVTNPTKDGVPEFDLILEKAKEAELSHLVIPYLHTHERGTADDYKRTADLFNAAAVKANEAGIQLSYHNHAFEFEPFADDSTGYGIFIERFAPEMKFEMDVFWVKVGGADPVDMLTLMKGRVSQLHLKDLEKDFTIPQYGSIPPESFKELGNGMIPMEPIIEAAAVAEVDHCHVEQDHSPDAMNSIRESMDYLIAL